MLAQHAFDVMWLTCSWAALLLSLYLSMQVLMSNIGEYHKSQKHVVASARGST
jgi:hypothetical protein